MSCKKDDEDTNLTILFRDWHLSIEEISSDDEESEHHLRPCKVPQMEADKSVNCDDKSNNFIFVVSDVSTVEVNLDSSSGSPDSVPNSLVHSISDSSDTCFLEAITIEETDVSLSSEASPLKMDTPRSRTKRRTDSERRDRDIKKFQKNANATSSPTIPKVVTRSGRAVRVRLDKKFDYSSSQPEEGEDELSVLSLESEDEDYQLDLTHEHPKWSARKHRRERSQSSQSSSSDSSSPSSQEAVSIIYLDLGQSVAIVRDEPLPDLSLEDDPELKTKVLKFLGLMPPRRRLYNPMESLDMDPEEERETEASSPAPRPLFISNSPAKQTTPSPKRTTPLGTLTTTWSSLKVSHLHPPTIEERQAKLYDDLVLQANASHMEAQTPDVVKEPIDLSGLPSEKLRANNCRRHKSSIGCLEQHPLFYRFVESLNPEISINMCHPLALTYRESDFDSCKLALAKVLFNVFNHAIFHCGLQTPIKWKRGMNQPCNCELSIDSAGQRTACILLWEQINQPGMLIKPLLHEMCHAAAFVFNRETGHGDNCRKWAYQAKRLMPELPLIGDCEETFKYTCSMCARCSYGHMRFTTESAQLRCHHCQFEVAVESWSSNDMYKGTRPDPAMTEFKTFVRDNYTKTGDNDVTHSAKMRLLNRQFEEMKE